MTQQTIEDLRELKLLLMELYGRVLGLEGETRSLPDVDRPVPEGCAPAPFRTTVERVDRLDWLTTQLDERLEDNRERLAVVECLLSSITSSEGHVACRRVTVVDDLGQERIHLKMVPDGTAEVRVEALGLDDKPSDDSVCLTATNEGNVAIMLMEAGNFAQVLDATGLQDDPKLSTEPRCCSPSLLAETAEAKRRQT